jgi:hypothetical protein
MVSPPVEETPTQESKPDETGPDASVTAEDGGAEGATSTQVDTLWLNPREILDWFQDRGARVVLLDQRGTPLAEIDEFGGVPRALGPGRMPPVVRDVSKELLPAREYHGYFGLDRGEVLAYMFVPQATWEEVTECVDPAKPTAKLELQASGGMIRVRELLR